MDSDSTGTAPTVNAFLTHLASERRLSPHTVSSYQRDLVEARKVLGTQPWDALTVHDIRSLAAALHRKGKSGKTIQRMLSTLRTFFRYLMREGLARDNPAMDIRAPKSGKRLPKALDAGQWGLAKNTLKRRTRNSRNGKHLQTFSRNPSLRKNPKTT